MLQHAINFERDPEQALFYKNFSDSEESFELQETTLVKAFSFS